MINIVKTVLLVDDAYKLQTSITEMLNKLSVSIDFCNTLLEAEIILKKEKYDLIFINASLKDLSISNFIDDIKIKNPKQLIVLILDRSDHKKIKKIMNIGIDDILYKPFEFKDLEDTINRFSF